MAFQRSRPVRVVLRFLLHAPLPPRRRRRLLPRIRASPRSSYLACGLPHPLLPRVPRMPRRCPGNRFSDSRNGTRCRVVLDSKYDIRVLLSSNRREGDWEVPLHLGFFSHPGRAQIRVRQCESCKEEIGQTLNSDLCY